jgi:hypothetical protein
MMIIHELDNISPVPEQREALSRVNGLISGSI